MRKRHLHNYGRVLAARVSALVALVVIAAGAVVAIGTGDAMAKVEAVFSASHDEANAPDLGIAWARGHFAVRSGIAGRRLCRVRIANASSVRSVRFSSTANPQVKVFPAGRPYRSGGKAVFLCRVEAQAPNPPATAPVTATVAGSDGTTAAVTATAVIVGSPETASGAPAANAPATAKTDPAEPTGPENPAEPTGPAEPREPNEPTEPAKPAEPTEPTKPVEPTEPSEPTQPTPPTEPVKPTEPTEPAKPSEPPSTGQPAEPAPASSQLFSPSSFWNRPLPASAPLVAQSAAYVQELARDVTQTAAWINTTSYSTPVYVVGPNAPTTKVTIATVDPLQQASLNAVPLPAGAQPAAGGDRHLVVWQPSANSMWEFWGMRFEAGHWVADASGAMDNVSTNPGYFDPGSWPGAKTWWGATATALPLLGGLMRIGELQHGSIEHALALAIPQTGSSFVWPAQRSDGHNNAATAIPEGTTFRLPSSVDVDSLGLPPAARTIAVAAQKYGMVVRDTSTDVSLYAEDPTPTGSNPYPQLFGGKSPAEVLAHFPWSQLVAVQQAH